MVDLEQLSKLRFGMTEVPRFVGQPGDYEEKWSQWFLERSFFCDFLYRNPRVKKGQELADAVVLFDDVVLMVQVKTQCGKHDPISWATEKLLEAFRQLRKTHENLVSGRIKKLKNNFYGDISFDPKCYPNRFGLIILAHDSESYIAAKLAPEILTADFSVHVFSLKDFALVASRFDTAGDLINFLELRTDIGPKIPNDSTPARKLHLTGKLSLCAGYRCSVHYLNLPIWPPTFHRRSKVKREDLL